jgi:hypothetical protein
MSIFALHEGDVRNFLQLSYDDVLVGRWCLSVGCGLMCGVIDFVRNHHNRCFLKRVSLIRSF